MLSKCVGTLFVATLAAAAGCDSSATGMASGDGAAPETSIDAPPFNGDAASDGTRLLGLWVAGDRTLDDRDEKSVRMEQGLAECTMQFDFRDAERVFIQMGRDMDVEQGRWQIVRSHGASLVLRIASPSCGEKDFRVQFVDDDRFTMSRESDADGELAFTLTRLRGAS